MKKCCVCKEIKEFSMFQKDSHRKDGLQNKCKQCRHNAMQQKSKEKSIQDKKRYETKKQEILHKSKEYRIKNSEKCKERSKKWREANKLKTKKWRNEHPNYFVEYHKKYRIENPEKIKAIKHKRKMIERQIIGSHSIEEWNSLLIKTNGFCSGYKRESHFVGIAKLTKDHIVPLSPKDKSIPGTDYIQNIQPLCRSCNARKNNNVV